MLKMKGNSLSRRKLARHACAVLFLTCAAAPLRAIAEEPSQAQVQAALDRALTAMDAARQAGGWATAWTPDKTVVWGEWRPIPQDWITVQPPATPTMAGLYLRAGKLVDKRWLKVAEEARDALLAIQTEAGGFSHEAGPHAEKRPPRGTFDDDTTTAAMDFFIDWWRHTKKKKDLAKVHGVGDFIIASQYESGGWPQFYPPSEGAYHAHITFNDGVMAKAIRALLRLHRETGKERYLDAAKRGGECIIRLQGGPGEGIWAQQYDAKTLKPAWARKFEPPGYTPAESRDVCNVLIELAIAADEERFLAPLPEAFAWYETHRLPNGKYARLYEPGSQRPAYGRRDKAEPVYDFENACTGYGWQGLWFPKEAKAAYRKLRGMGFDAYRKQHLHPKPRQVSAPSEAALRRILDAQQADGLWRQTPGGRQITDLAEKSLPEGTPLVGCRSFRANITLLLDYVEALDKKEEQKRD